MIGGFQFAVDGATVSSAAGGDAADAGFTVQAAGGVVLGFSFTGGTIPAGCGTLTQLTLDGMDRVDGIEWIGRIAGLDWVVWKYWMCRGDGMAPFHWIGRGPGMHWTHWVEWMP